MKRRNIYVLFKLFRYVKNKIISGILFSKSSKEISQDVPKEESMFFFPGIKERLSCLKAGNYHSSGQSYLQGQ